MRLTPKLLCVTALAALVTAGASTAASAGPAASQLVDGVITAAGSTCTWTGAAADADPPAALTIDNGTVNSSLSCTGGASATLNNSPTLTFDDAAGTAASDLIDITVKQSIVTCSYQATGVGWTRDGSTRTYLNEAFTASKSSGSFLCPGSITADPGSASLTFH
ncbi:hypothetical protein P8A18_27595 [Streptomyces castrisilvae]|uniref:Ig-like domain-containing protein n=1 Tax=Streptomyces castrisilvae TaxID=3033811 RepID=A0ABY9HQX6_9ACTN|nr:hypothetical protein [Streptomyces sp. Mut1]WLQ36963.1 hypothetical protein P8A18_27595 [Streptomyces sp. Mut1]